MEVFGRARVRTAPPSGDGEHDADEGAPGGPRAVTIITGVGSFEARGGRRAASGGGEGGGRVRRRGGFGTFGAGVVSVEFAPLVGDGDDGEATLGGGCDFGGVFRFSVGRRHARVILGGDEDARSIARGRGRDGASAGRGAGLRTARLERGEARARLRGPAGRSRAGDGVAEGRRALGGMLLGGPNRLLGGRVLVAVRGSRRVRRARRAVTVAETRKALGEPRAGRRRGTVHPHARARGRVARGEARKPLTVVDARATLLRGRPLKKNEMSSAVARHKCPDCSLV